MEARPTTTSPSWSRLRSVDGDLGHRRDAASLRSTTQRRSLYINTNTRGDYGLWRPSNMGLVRGDGFDPCLQYVVAQARAGSSPPSRRTGSRSAIERRLVGVGA